MQNQVRRTKHTSWRYAKRSVSTACGLGFAALLISSGTQAQNQAQNYPNRPIQISYPFPGGATSDILRNVLIPLEKSFGQPIVFEYRPGGNEVPSMLAVLNGAADGYLIGVSTQNFSLNPAVQKLPYQQRDFVPITQFTTWSSLLVVNSAFPARTLKDFINYAKANPNKINFATIGHYHSIALSIFEEATGVKMTHVPFKGTPDSIQALLGGHVQAIFMATGQALNFEKDKRVVVLGSGTPARMADLPNVPVISELVPGYSLRLWLGLFAKAGVPRNIIDRWAHGVREAIKAPEVIRVYEKYGYYPASQTPEEFAAYVQKETEAFGSTAKKMGIVPQ